MITVLIVDDDSSTRRLLRHFLIGEGLEVVDEANDAFEAKRMYNKYKPDLVTMDINMPGIDGIEGVKRIIKIDPEAVIIMVTAYGEKEKVLEAIKAGAKNYILKPLNRAAIRKIIDTVIAENKIKKEQQPPAAEEIREDNDTPAGEAQEEPFDITNPEGGKFYININPGLDQGGFEKLSRAVEGILIIKPTKIMLNFDKIDDLNPEVRDLIVGLIKNITESHGIIDVLASKNVSVNNHFLQYIKEQVSKMKLVYTISPEDAAKLLKTTPEQVYEWLSSGELPGIKIGRFWGIKEEDLSKIVDIGAGSE